MRGRFITFEGGEGVGKSTQLRRLKEGLEGRGHGVVATREPGGTPGAEAIRRLAVEGESERWDPLAELFLMLASRQEHLHRLIRPALDEGRTVLCDRFFDSSRVYQGLAGGLGLDLVDRLHEPVLRGLRPDLTLLLDLPPEVGLRRAGPGRFEAKGRDFHERVRAGFLRLCTNEPDRFALIDGTDEPDAVAAAIWAAVAERLGIDA